MGRPVKSLDPAEIQALRDRGYSWERVAETLGVHRNTLFRQRIVPQSETVEAKYCNGCEQTLSTDDFTRDRSRRDGRNIRCRKCVAKQWHKANRRECETCGAWCVGGQCRRCYRMESAILNVEEDVFMAIPRLLWQGRIIANKARREKLERKRFARVLVSKLSGSKLSRAERLRVLLESVVK